MADIVPSRPAVLWPGPLEMQPLWRAHQCSGDDETNSSSHNPAELPHTGLSWECRRHISEEWKDKVAPQC